jgi:hypothetical protein
MKKILLFALLALSVSRLPAQVNGVKTLLIQNKFKEAKDELDKNMGNAKFTALPEAWMMKALIYATLSMAEGTKNTPQGDKLAEEAMAAFQKYQQMDPKLSLIDDPIYKDGPINLYNSFAVSGYDDYTKDKWDVAFAKFKKAVQMSDLLIANKVFTMTLDTTIVYLAGVTAQNSKNVDDALIYYKRLADIKMKGDGYENMYKYMVYNYFVKKDFSNFEKYKALGAELFPTSEYFTYDKIDFAYDVATSFDDKVKTVEEVLAAEPNNYKGNLLLGQIIFDTLHPRRENDPVPSNAAELESKMVTAFNKATAAKPDDVTGFLFLGDHYYTKADKINEARTQHASDMKARTKPGAMASKEDVAKRDLLDKQYLDAMEMARDPYEKAAALFAAKPTLDMREKQQYKKVCNYLSEIYAFKKVMSKAKPADQQKFAAEEKKWNDRYDSIK